MEGRGEKRSDVHLGVRERGPDAPTTQGDRNNWPQPGALQAGSMEGRGEKRSDAHLGVRERAPQPRTPQRARINGAE
jgi:hypothetical protein